MRVRQSILRLAAFVCGLGLTSLMPAMAAETAKCTNTVWADVVALDQPIMINRLGTVRPGGEIYALRRDAVRRFVEPGQRQDMPELLDQLCAGQRRVLTWRSQGRWLDIGKPDDYALAQGMPEYGGAIEG